MRWLWQGRAKNAAGGAVADPTESSQRQTRRGWLAFLPGKREAALSHGPWLRLAHDYLLAQGARIRSEDATLIAGDQADGTSVTYTDALERAQAQADALLLVPGSAAASAIVADIEARTRVGAMRLAPADAPLALAASFWAAAPIARHGAQSVAAGLREGPGQLGYVQEGRLTLHWEKPPVRTTVSRTWERTTLELEYRVAGRDRFGRLADTARIGIDSTSGNECPAIEPTQAAAAQSARLTASESDMTRAVLSRMEERLRPQLDAAASFLRMRSEAEYRGRIEVLNGVAERMRREQPEDLRETEQALKREVAALGAVFAVEVECALAAIWVVHTPMASAICQLPGGAQVELTLDLGRATATPLTCASCQASTLEAAICAHTHILCAACSDLAPGTCAICAAQSSAGKTPKRRTVRQPARASRKEPAAELTLDGLTSLWPAMWQACVGWLLEQQGFTVNTLPCEGAEARWRGVDSDGQDVFIHALRGDSAQAIRERDITETIRLARELGLERALLLSAGVATPPALAVSEAAHIRLIDGEMLRAQLATLGGSYDRHVESAQAETKARARAAIGARAAIQQALATALMALVFESDQQRAVGSAALARAREQLGSARVSAEQAFVAWETLVANWLAAFASAPAHDGSLAFLLDASGFKTLRERGVHLGSALANILREIADTPSDGEMGYGAWRATVVEEARLRLDARRARLDTVDPAQWAEFDLARPAAQEVEASQAEIAAARASARADKAQSQVTQLAG
jgi:hypothetical protein